MHVSSKSSKPLLILNLWDILYPTCWNFIFLLFVNQCTFSDDNDMMVMIKPEIFHTTTTTLLIVNFGDKSFWSNDCNLLVCFWPFDKEMELWIKKVCKKWMFHWSLYEPSSIRNSYTSFAFWYEASYKINYNICNIWYVPVGNHVWKTLTFTERFFMLISQLW